jgi:hypothetical protein
LAGGFADNSAKLSEVWKIANAIGQPIAGAKMEASDPTLSLDPLVRSLLALGASNPDLGQIIVEVE